MTSPWSNSPTQRFLEILAMIILTAPPLTYPHTFAHLLVEPTLVIHFVVTIILAIALVYEPFRSPARWLLVGTGLYSVTLRPEAVESVPLFLLGVYLTFREEWTHDQRKVYVTVLAGLFALAQIGSYFVGALSVVEPTRWLVLDALILLLVFSFRKDLFPPPPIHRPKLLLYEKGFTNREMQIVHLIWGGETPKQIAHSLEIADATVRKDLSYIYHKTGVPGLKELAHLIHTHEVVWEAPPVEVPLPQPVQRFRV